MTRSASITIAPQFYDIDPMGVVWHGNYVRYFEQARCALLDQIDYNYRQMQESGYLWPIVDMRVKYVRSVRFEQSVIVTATITETANRLKIDYVVTDKKTGEVLTKAHTIQVAVDVKTGELCLESPAALTDKVSVPL
jgi:acyl-CoA thioester hydrolase